MMKTKPIRRDRLIKYLDEYLQISAIIEDSVNGLQVEGASVVKKIALAVDACLQTIRAAARVNADMLIVHHGLLWGRNERITGGMQKRIHELLSNNISLYAAHLPLDCHEEVGNSIELARILGMQYQSKFARYHGVEIGVIAAPAKPLSRSQLLRKLERSLKAKASVLPFGPIAIKKAGIISGGGIFLAAEAKHNGCDTFITGETSHLGYHFAKEAKMNMVFAGHYASETVGLKALGKHLWEKFSINCKFISAPTGF